MDMGIKRITEKLKGKVGESIAETLVALLISALALTMLAGAISAGSNMIRTSRAKISTYYNESENLATFSSTTGDADVTINDFSDSVSVEYVEVKTFSKTPVVAYKKKS